MRSFKSGPICPSCLFTAANRIATKNVRPSFANQRFYSGGKRPPSRMLLSDRVDRPSRRDESGRGGKGTPKHLPGPFGGMNQTTVPQGLRDRSPRPPPRPSRRGEDRDKRGSRNDERRTKAMKMHSALATISTGHRTRTKESISIIDSFGQLELLPSVKQAISEEALKGMVNLTPTPIQRLAIPALIGQQMGRRSRTRHTPGRQEFLLAAETGSGKTLAYLLPIVNAIKIEEESDPAIAAYREYFSTQMANMEKPDYTGPWQFGPHPTMARPKAIILVPSAELVDQVGAVAKSLSHVVKFKSTRFSATVPANIIRSVMYSPSGIDLIVSTPHLLSSMADTDPNILSRVRHLVIDEADSLFDRSFAPVTTSILDRALPSLKNLRRQSPRGLTTTSRQNSPTWSASPRRTSTPFHGECS